MALANELKNREKPNPQSARQQALVSWIMENLEEWADHRDANYKKKWDEYYRIWRGIFHNSDKTRKAERSKLISPSTQQAIEMIVSDIEEATFGKGKWFDLTDDIQDPEKKDKDFVRDQLLEDFELAKIPRAVGEIYLISAIYGTGIGKLITSSKTEKVIVAHNQTQDVERVEVSLEPIMPDDFVIDPDARSPDEGLGCAHEMIKPKNSVLDKQKKGIYYDIDVGGMEESLDLSGKGESRRKDLSHSVKIVEYYGLVPRDLLPVETENDEEVVDLFEKESPESSESYWYDDTDLVEAIITIANDAYILREIENPTLMQDRPIIAFQHDTVPNRFWGRGIAEKGYNTQKALDAELRARIDGMAYTIYPMLGLNVSNLPKGLPLEPSPGKVWPFVGNPQESLYPFSMGNVNQQSFMQTGELERMHQMATGAMDSATPISQNPRNQTSSGMSMIMSGAIKRSKRTMRNIEWDFLGPLIMKSLWRYIEFDRQRYPVLDYKYIPKSSMGLMAREYEQGQMIQLLSIVPPDSPLYGVLMKSIYDNTNLSNKEEAKAIIDQMFTPPPPDPLAEKAKELEVIKLQREVDELESKILENLAKAESLGVDADNATYKAITDRMNVVFDAAYNKNVSENR